MTHSTESQNKQIAMLLKKFGVIHRFHARSVCGCERLAARIYDLKQLGYKISSQIKTNKRSGTRWAEYGLIKASKRH